VVLTPTNIGTTRGFVSLWDIRYNIMSKLWRHSSNGPIYRLASCKSLPRQSPLQQLQQNFNMPATEGAYLFAAAGEDHHSCWIDTEYLVCASVFT
jgi:hypothetical protein